MYQVIGGSTAAARSGAGPAGGKMGRARRGQPGEKGEDRDSGSSLAQGGGGTGGKGRGRRVRTLRTVRSSGGATLRSKVLQATPRASTRDLGRERPDAERTDLAASPRSPSPVVVRVVDREESADAR